MFRITTPKPYRLPLYVCIVFGATLLYFVGIYAQGQAPAPAPSPAPEPTLEYIKSLMGTITTVAGFIALIAGIVLGLLNKTNTDRLKANVAELEDIVETKERRNTELKLQAEADAAKAALRVKNLETEAQTLKISNEALAGYTLQMKAILRGLRLSGAWGGHEDQIIPHKTEG